MSLLPFIEYGNLGEKIHFAHANAYPPASYHDLLESLGSKHRVLAFEQRPLWSDFQKPEVLKNWYLLADDLIDFCDQQQLKNIVGIGHSMGAVASFMAAQKRPDIFRGLVMIEPVAFSRMFCWLNRLTPWILKRRVPLIKKTLNRPDQWKNQQLAFDFHRKARAFSRVSDSVLWSYIKAGVVKENGDCYLRYSKSWEVRCYATISYYRNQLLSSTLPILAFRGEYTDTISLKFWQKWQKNPHHKLIQHADKGHLLPFEAPEILTEEILRFIVETGKKK